MKIAIVHTSADSSRGGAETSIVEMATALAALDQDVTIVSRGAKADNTSSITNASNQPKVKVVSLPSRGLTKTAQMRHFFSDAAEFCRADPFEIVHAVVPMRGCDVYQPRGGTYAATQAANLDILRSDSARFVKELLQPFNRKQQILHRLEWEMLSANPPHVAVVSKLGERQITDLVPGFSRDKLRTIFNACDVRRIAQRSPEARIAAREALSINPEQSVVLFIAHNFKLKGLRELIEAVSVLKDEVKRPLLLIAGRDNPRPYQNMANSLALTEHVRFLGSSARVSDLYSAADILAHPTWYDPCSRVVLEALCHGLPVVTTRRNGAAEVLGEGCGFAVESPANTHELASAMRQAMSNIAGEAALHYASVARERLSMERHARELIELYTKIRSCQ